MDYWFKKLAKDFVLPAELARHLDQIGRVVLTGVVAPEQRASLAAAYDAALLAAHPDDVARKSTTRVHDFVNRGPAFDAVYLFDVLLAACCHIIGRPFKLSSLLARTVEPGAPAQTLHADFPRYDDGWPMVGFILMIDDFYPDNGATRFVRGSHLLEPAPNEALRHLTAEYNYQGLACGPAGSLIIYNGSIWHGHTANVSARPRRSLQGAFIRREDRAATDFSARMQPATLARLGGLAKYLLDLEAQA